MIAELASLQGLWSAFFIGCLGFGFAPGAVLRIVVLLLPKADARRRELIAELREVPRLERPVWVAEQFETCLFEGITLRIRGWRRSRRRQSLQTATPPSPLWLGVLAVYATFFVVL